MTGLVFKKLSIVSKLEKAARTVELTPGVNVLTGVNDVGKSTLIKSLYYTIGADVPQMANTRWKRAKAFYCAEIEIDGTSYKILRDGKHFGVFDHNRKLLSKHTGISSEGGIADFICKKLGFNIELERNSDGKLGRAGPAFYYLPFYVDQDEGWNKSWNSFLALTQFTAYRKQMLEYHLGIRPQAYYDALKQSMEKLDDQTDLNKKRGTLSVALESFQKRLANAQVDLNPEDFRIEMEQLVDEYNLVRAKQQDALSLVKEFRNERNGVDTDIVILRRSISELDADYRFAADLETPDEVGCPTCGTTFENSLQQRFGLLDDVAYCQSILDQRLKDRQDIDLKLKEAEKTYKEVCQSAHGVSQLLERKKSTVSLRDIVMAEGSKEVVTSLQSEISDYDDQIAEIQKSIDALKAKMKLDSEHKKKIVEYYQSRMKQFLNELNVFVLEESDYASPEKIIKNNALGSDLPRALLAQYYALLHTMKKFGSTKICPLVIDSPIQQEQDPKNIDAIFKFIVKNMLPQQQLILGTISFEAPADESLPENWEHIELSDEYSVLSNSQYDSVMSDVGTMHEVMLSA